MAEMTTGVNLKVLLLGSSGLLGSNLGPYLESRGYNIITQGRCEGVQYQVNLDDREVASELLGEIEPEIIVNLIGLTDVDQCETQPNQAYLANVRTVENIAAWIRNNNISTHLIHISTDQVYDGIGPHCEDHVTLTNYYAFSKYAGELAAAITPNTILRTNFVGLSHCAKRESLTDWLFSSLLKESEVQVFDDVLFNPLSMNTLSEIIELAIQQKPIGVFNLGSNDGISKADFAFSFAEFLGLPTHNMMRISIAQANFLKTYRPKDMRMDCSRLESKLGIKLPSLINEINRVAEEYSEIS